MIRWLLAVVLVLAAALSLLGCPTAVCQRLETRCANDVAQVCNANGQWQDVMTCGNVEPGRWACGEVSEEGHSCISLETDQ